MKVIVVIEGEQGAVFDEAGRMLLRPGARMLRRKFTREELEAPRCVGFFDASMEYGDLEIGDRVPRCP